MLLPVYHRPTGQIVNMFDRNPMSSPVTSPQSYVVDHFGRAGAQAVIDDWDSVLLTSRVGALPTEVGGSIFEDSIEIKNTQYWTPGLLQKFETRRGYSVEPYLPILMNRTMESFFRPAEPAFTLARGPGRARPSRLGSDPQRAVVREPARANCFSGGA